MAIKPLICISILMPWVFADAPAAKQEPVQQKTGPVDQNAYVYCPTIESLVRDNVNGKWSAPGGWFSQHYSFAKKIDNFLGAAYSGGEIGHVDCYFTSNETGDVRIVLKNTKLVQIPKTDSWAASEKDASVKLCKKDSSDGCPFFIYNESQHIGSLEDAILNIPK